MLTSKGFHLLGRDPMHWSSRGRSTDANNLEIQVISKTQLWPNSQWFCQISSCCDGRSQTQKFYCWLTQIWRSQHDLYFQYLSITNFDSWFPTCSCFVCCNREIRWRPFFSLRKKKIHHRSGFTGWHLAPGTRPDLQQEPLNLGRIGIQLDATWDQTGKINLVRIISWGFREDDLRD